MQSEVLMITRTQFWVSILVLVAFPLDTWGISPVSEPTPDAEFDCNPGNARQAAQSHRNELLDLIAELSPKGPDIVFHRRYLIAKPKAIQTAMETLDRLANDPTVAYKKIVPK